MTTELEKQMQKLKDMGVTISVQTGDGREPRGITGAIKEAAQDAGIYGSKKASN